MLPAPSQFCLNKIPSLNMKPEAVWLLWSYSTGMRLEPCIGTSGRLYHRSTISSSPPWVSNTVSTLIKFNQSRNLLWANIYEHKFDESLAVLQRAAAPSTWTTEWELWWHTAEPLDNFWWLSADYAAWVEKVNLHSLNLLRCWGLFVTAAWWRLFWLLQEIGGLAW
jgi:hypothetical protein